MMRPFAALSSRSAMVTVFACCLTLSAGCSGEPKVDKDRPGNLPSRRFVATEWSTDFQVGGTLEDTVLQTPMQPAVTSDGLYVVDAFMKRVEHFDLSGNLLWTYGQEGEGPDEFRAPRDLKVDSSGRVWVLDQQNMRITVIDRDGKAVMRIPLHGARNTPHSFVPLPGDEVFLVVPDPAAPLVRLARDGTVLERRPFPWKGFAEMTYLAAQLTTGMEPKSGRWVAAFQAGDGFFTFDGPQQQAGRKWWVEPVAFPRVIQSRSKNKVTTRMAGRPTYAAASVALSPERLYVLFAGATGKNNRIVDSYSLADGTYIESFLLPKRVKQIAWNDGKLYVLHNNPFPALAALEPRGARLP
jgi:hypothetical protein